MAKSKKTLPKPVGSPPPAGRKMAEFLLSQSLMICWLRSATWGSPTCFL